MEIFAAVYEVMLQILARYFAHTDEDDEQLYVLKSAFLNLMPFVLTPIGKECTQLPAGDGFAGKNAGPELRGVRRRGPAAAQGQRLGVLPGAAG